MRIAICIKQVPDAEARLRIAKDNSWIDEDGLRFITSDSDRYALEEGLALAEQTGGEAIVISLGPARAKDELRKGLAMGAARAIHLVDDAFQGGDAAATARALAAVIRKEEAELVLTGSQSDDHGWGATASILAGHLGWPHAWLVMGVELEDGHAKVTREMESGMNEILRLKLPAVIEVQAGINHPRYAPLRGIMQAKRKPMDTPSPADLGLSADEVGSAGSRVEIVDVAFPDSGDGAEIFEGDAEAIAKQLVVKLQNEARVL